MPNADNSAEQIDALLRQVRSIAVVGASADPSKASYEVMDYLINHGYEVVAVNPVTEHTHILGVPVFKTLADIPHPIDMVDVFRPKAELHSVAEQAIAINAKVLWGQLDIVDKDAAAPIFRSTISWKDSNTKCALSSTCAVKLLRSSFRVYR